MPRRVHEFYIIPVALFGKWSLVWRSCRGQDQTASRSSFIKYARAFPLYLSSVPTEEQIHWHIADDRDMITYSALGFGKSDVTCRWFFQRVQAVTADFDKAI